VCHPALPLQQFEGCFSITTTPELPVVNGEMFTLPITVAACFELHDTEDPREQFVQLWSSDVDNPETPDVDETETPRPLESTDASQLLGADADDCSENIVTVASSNVFARLASTGLRKLQAGLSLAFGVKTAYAVDVGLGGLTKLLSNISPAMTAEIRPHTNTQLEFVSNGTTPVTTTSTARIVGTRAHGNSPVLNVGIGGVPITYTLSANGGSLRPLGSIEAPGLSSLTIITNTNPFDESPTSGGGFAPVNWTLPTAPGVYTLTATGPALAGSAGPVTFTATVTAALPDPELAFIDTQVILLSTGNLVAHRFSVTNYTVYPAAMFAPTAMSPCDDAMGSRTRVEIYDDREEGDDILLRHWCDIESPSGLQTLSFVRLQSTPAPSLVYVKLVDRATGLTYISNSVSPTAPPPPPVTINGVMTAGEWDDATQYGPFTVNLPFGASTTATLHLKNTSTQLLGVLQFARDITPYEWVTVRFRLDENGNGTWDNDEDGFSLFSWTNGFHIDVLLDTHACVGGCSETGDTETGGQNDGTTKSTAGPLTTIEFSKGINSADAGDALLSPGQILRFNANFDIRQGTLTSAAGWTEYTVK
jgi:hypothetical protein